MKQAQICAGQVFPRARLFTWRGLHTVQTLPRAYWPESVSGKGMTSVVTPSPNLFNNLGYPDSGQQRQPLHKVFELFGLLYEFLGYFCRGHARPFVLYLGRQLCHGLFPYCVPQFGEGFHVPSLGLLEQGL